ncbi:MAG: hypothetical protein AB1295_03595 [Candidatus Micrarchaeota archaeon]
MKRRKVRQPAPKKEMPPKRSGFLRYALLTAAIASGIGAAYSLSRSRCDQDKAKPAPQDMIGREKGSTIPAHDITIRYLAQGRGDPRFDAVDRRISSILDRTDQSICPYEFGGKTDLGSTMEKIRKTLAADGLGILSDSADPKAMLRELHEYYLKNDVWFLLRTIKSERADGGSEMEYCLFRYPVKRRALLSFSFFEGRLSARDIPVFILGGEMPEKADGVVTRKGVLVFPDFLRDHRKIASSALEDCIVHEGIHYNTIMQEGGGDFQGDIDFDEMEPDTPAKAKARERDELRAHLINMIFGHHPKTSLAAIHLSRRESYKKAREAISIGIAEHLRRFDHERFRRLMSRRLPLSELEADEIRRIAHAVFVRHRLWDL